jgi:transposase-like protein
MELIVKNATPEKYADELSCPHCLKHNVKFKEVSGPFHLRYQCKDCGGTLIYDISNRPELLKAR